MASPTYYQSAGKILEEQHKNADDFDRQLAIAQACSALAVVDSVNALRADIAALRDEVASLNEMAGHQAGTLADLKNLLAQIGMRIAS